MLRPIDISILDAKHLALPAAGFQRAYDAVVHRRPGRSMVVGVHQTRREQRLLLVAVNPTISLRLVANLGVHSEAVKRARGQQPRILEASPIDRGSKNSERAVHGRDFVSLQERCLEPGDLASLLESYHRRLSERDFDVAVGLRHRPLQTYRLHFAASQSPNERRTYADQWDFVRKAIESGRIKGEEEAIQ
jgi:hypothetical protein